jgi:hypothetical protein
METNIAHQEPVKETANEPLPLTHCSAFGLYRPDGSLCRVSLSTQLSEGQEDNILSNAWREIQPDDDERPGIPRPDAEIAAKAAGWRVFPIIIQPNKLL